MKRYVIILSVFLFGFIVFKAPNTQPTDLKYSFNLSQLNNFNSGYLYLDIFLNNLLICLFIAFFGFLSGGVITLIVIFWNGYLLSMFMKTGYSLMQLSDFIYFSKHIPLELISIFMFANFGLGGGRFFKELIFEKKFYQVSKKEVTMLIFPVILLLISSIVETL